jgi:hypothetical protein
MIKFDEKNHKYYNDRNEEYISVTTFLGEQFPFDFHAITERLISNPNSEYYKMTKADIAKKWNQSAVQGTKLHNAVEKYIKEGVEEAEDPVHKHCVSMFKRLKFRGKILSETLVWDDDLRIAGTCDILEDCGDHFWLYDIKTSSSINKDKKVKFSYQLEIYKRLIEKMFNKKVHTGAIIWFEDYIEKGTDTKLKMIKPIECSKVVDELLIKRKMQLSA